MSELEPSDETLMAFADGELDPVTMRAIAARRATDPALADRIRVFELSAQLARQALDGIAREPVPLRLLAAVQPPRPTWPRFAASRPLQALAASLVLAVGLGAGYLAGHDRGGGGLDAMVGLAACSGGLSRALETAASGERRADGGCIVVPVASYRDGSGTVCREFQATQGINSGRSAMAGIACRDAASNWRPRVAVDITPGAGDSYRPASGPGADDGLAAMRAALGLDAARLSKADEDQLRQSGWSSRP